MRAVAVTCAFVLGACTPVMPGAPLVCSASTCPGCCDSTGACRGGDTTSACGRLGLVCSVCQTGQRCVAGLCQAGASTTAGGTATGGGFVTAGGFVAAGGFVTAGGSAAGGTSTAGGSGDPLGGGGAAAGGASGGSTGGGSAGGSPLTTRFEATLTRFAVPDARFFRRSAAPTTGTFGWSTTDLDGDGFVDLVVTASDMTGAIFNTAGVTHWNVYRGTSSGFSATPVQWLVAMNAGVPQGYNVTDSEAAPYTWATVDVTRDQRAELVHTMNPVSNGPYITSATATLDGWLVRRNLSDRFDSNTITLTVPKVPGMSVGIDRVFSDLANRRWSLVDLNGDRQPELALTADPATDQPFLNAGVSSWAVCTPNSTTGAFGAFTTGCPRLSVRATNAAPGGFRSAMANDVSARRVWLLIDLNSDGRADLVQTMNPATGSTFSNGAVPSWRVWLNQFSLTQSTLFGATPLDWPVPSANFTTPSSASGTSFWDLFDLNGDGRPELVITADRTTGQPFPGPSWQVYGIEANSGFSPIPAPWMIPNGPAPDGFRSLTGATWSVFDVTGDGRPDLVVTEDSGATFADGNGPFWSVYAGIP